MINRWYHGTEPHDLSHLDDRTIDPSLPNISGGIRDSFISLDQEWPVDVGSQKTRLTLAELDEIDGWAYLYLRFGMSRSTTDKVIPLTYVQYYQDGVAFGSREIVHTFKPSWTFGWWRITIGYSSTRQWATGKFGVTVYDGDRKVAQVEYEVAP